MVSVACDICGQLYEFQDQLLGKLQKCRECETRFEVSETNAPFETNPEDGESSSGGFAGFGRVLRGTAAGIAILSACVWMTMLLFKDPWQRPPLDFRVAKTSKSSSRPASTGSAPPATSRSSMASPSTLPTPVSPANPADTPEPPGVAAPPVLAPPNHTMSEERRAELNQRLEALRNRRQNPIAPPQMPDLQPRDSNPPGAAPNPSTNGSIP